MYIHRCLRLNCAPCGRSPGSQTPGDPAPRGALDDEELFIIEGPENWRSTPGQPGGARKMRKNREKPLHRHHTLKERKCPPALAMGTQRARNNCPESNELQLWDLDCLTCTTNIDHLVNVLQLENLYGFPDRNKGNCLCATTGTSSDGRHLSLHDHSDCSEPLELHLRQHDDLHSKDINHLVGVLQLRDLRSFLHSNTTWGISTKFSPPAPENMLDLRNKDVEHLINGMQLENLSGLLNWTKGNDFCAVTGQRL